jgi:hypothetical protein
MRSTALAQDTRAQYPRILSNSYIGLQVGYIDYPFSISNMEAGFKAESIRVPHLAVRALLFGHEFNKYLSAQITYMRPVQWVTYEGVTGNRDTHSVWMNVAGLTGKVQWPLTKALSVYGEGGLGIITRKGFKIDDTSALKDANYASLLVGGGLQYRVNSNWSLVAGLASSRAHSGAKQPRTLSFSGGFNYTIRPLPIEQVQRNSDSRFIFPTNLFQFGYITDAFGYGANDFVSKGAVPVFWAADVRVAHGASMNFQRNVFHTRRVFALDWGAGVSSWKSKNRKEEFTTLSLYPVLRFTALHTEPLDLYLNYSLAGPTFISRTTIDGHETGRRFTFQDFMGVGVFTDPHRHMNAEIRIAHYSNGNLFPRNAGLTIPLGFNVGYAF